MAPIAIQLDFRRRPASGGRIRLGDASIKAAAAANVTYQPGDRLVTCWANTLRGDPTSELTDRIIPLPGRLLHVQ